MKIRKAEKMDVSRIYEIYQQGVAYLASQGIAQWQEGYPTIEIIEKDLALNELYVIENDCHIVGVTMFMLRHEPTYDQIDGKWLTQDDATYGTIHRIAIDNEMKGQNIGGQLLAFCEQIARKQRVASIRVDTHSDNHSMQKFLTNSGFVFCGDIKMLDGAPRIAFEKII